VKNVKFSGIYVRNCVAFR